MRVLVSGCTRNVGITILRSLVKAGHVGVGIDERPMPFGLHTRYATQCEHYTASSDDEAIRAIEETLRRHQPEVFIAGQLTPLLAAHRTDLEKHTRLLLPDAEAYRRLTDKLELASLCRTLGISVAREMSEREAVTYLEANRADQAKVVIKPRADIGGGAGVVMIEDPARIHSTFDEIEHTYGPAYISEYIPGPSEDIIAVNLLFDRNSRLIDYFAFRKLRIWPPRRGVSALAYSVHAGDIVRRLLPIFETLGWRGPADAELKIDERSGEAVLLEINGRFTGALAFSTACGINFPALLCDSLAGRGRVSDLAPRYREGLLYWHPFLFAKSMLHAWHASGYRWSELERGLSQARKKKAGGPWQLDDPAPLFGKLLIQCRESWQRLAAGGRKPSVDR